MIDNSLAAGCLKEVVEQIHEQTLEQIQWQAWLYRGKGSFAQFKAKQRQRVEYGG